MRLLICWPMLAGARLWGAEGIVSTAPSFTESLFALGLGPRVLAVSQYCHYPPEVAKLPRVGTYLQPNIEAIAKLQPGLVLAHAEQKQVVEQLKALGLRVAVLRNTTLEDALRSIREIGASAGHADRGLQLENALRGRLAAIEKASASRARRSLLFIVGRTPGRLDGMIAAGKGSFLNEIIRMAGGRNVLGDSPVAYPRISLETVIRLNPDVIVDMGDMSATADVTQEHTRSVTGLWSTQSASIRAVASGNVHAVAADIFVVPGPRVVEAAEAFSRFLQAARSSR